METFLEKTADYILNNYINNTQNLTVVLPNRRGSLYLKKYISQKIAKPIFLPDIISIEDFIIKIAELEIADNVFLLLEFYKSYCNIEGDNAKDFQEVFKWAKQVLKDYNEIDLYLVNPDDIFKAIDEATVIKTWNLGAPLTPYQKRYLKFFQSLGLYYNEFANNLSQKKYAYQGFVYRRATEKINSFIKNSKNQTFLFAGLNALTPSEEKIIFTLKNEGYAKLLWDADEYYMTDTKQEAGFFLRRFKKLIKDNEFLWNENNISLNKKKINITGTQGKVLQAKHAGNILKEMINNNNNIENVALVLADEKLLFPVLNSIPKNLDKFNITMGAPLAQLPIAQVYESLFNLHLNSKVINGKTFFPATDIVEFIEHPYIYKLFESVFNNIIKNLKSGKAYFESNEVLNFSDNNNTKNLLKLIVSDWDNKPSKALCDFKSINNQLINIFSSNEKTTDNIEYEYIFHFQNIIKKFDDIIKQYDIEIGIKPFYSLFRHALNSVQLPFYGEPLCGLQIMGLLETRTLDFEKIILLSANEGVLPAGKSEPTFIPSDIRKIYRLPVTGDKDAVYAYHFYRLLHKCNELHIIYNTKQDTFGAGEKSRFIKQIEYELPQLNSNTIITNNIVTFNEININNANPIYIEKNEYIFNKLKARAIKGLAPSALNSYIACPLKFYFSQIAEIPEKDDDIYDINHARFGSAVHEVLDILYKNILNVIPQPEMLHQMRKDAHNITNWVFNNKFENFDISSGKNLLAYNAVQRIVENYLHYEEKRIKYNPDNFVVHLLEQTLNYTRIFNINDEEIEVLLKGKADRIDINANVARIIDYKTGKTYNNELNAEKADDLLINTNLSKCFQLLMYSYLFSKNENCRNSAFVAGIISVGSPTTGFMKAKLNNSSQLNISDLKEVEEVIFQIINQIFDKNIAFEQTKNLDNCKYCSYLPICSRD